MKINKTDLHESGRPLTKEEFELRIKTDDEFSAKFGNLGKIYGYQWRNWNGNIDQISDLIKQLKENPDSRRLLVSAWNVSDLPHQVLPPCHYGFQVYTRELSLNERLPKKIKLKGHSDEIEFSLTDKREIKYYGKTKESNESLERVEKLKDNEVFYQTEFGWGVFFNTDTFKTVSYDGTEWGGQKLNIPTRAISLMWNQRSVDSFLGLPFNIASYGLLLEIIAKAVNMVPDELIGNLGDTHLYLNHIEQAKEQIGRELSFEERRDLMVKYTQDNNLLPIPYILPFGEESKNKYLEICDKYKIPKRTRESYPLPTLNINTEFWPTDSGECGVGPIDAQAVFNGFTNDHFCRCLLEEDLQLANYQSHPTIKAPLSN